MKIMTILGCRPEIIRLSETIKLLDKNVNHILVHTGQNYDYELNQIFFKDLDLRKPDYFLGVVGNTLGETLGNVMFKAEEVMLKEQPDAVLILGDTNSALSAIIAKRLKIPIFHLEAGNRCFDERVPEEINRKIVDHISDINVVYTSLQRDYLIQEGLPMDRIFISGSPMAEVLTNNNKTTDILDKLNLKYNEYFVISLHREENMPKIKELLSTINIIAETYKIPIVFSCHPRTKKMIEGKPLHQLVILSKPFGFNDYITLQMNAKCVISDSGTVAEESNILGFKAITIREAIERPEAINAGSIIMTGTNYLNILKSLEVTLNTEIDNDIIEYYDMNFSTKILKLILSYTDYVNRRVWYK